jgi:DNA-binding MarR family transcriptional regulator
MPSLGSTVEEIDRLARKLMRNIESCDRTLVNRRQLTTSQAYTLQALGERGEVAMNGLADEMRLHGTTMTRMVDVLVDKGFVARAADPLDRRVVKVSLTALGLEAVAEIRERKREFLATALRDVPEEELSIMLDGLGRLAALSEPWGATSRAGVHA